MLSSKACKCLYQVTNCLTEKKNKYLLISMYRMMATQLLVHNIAKRKRQKTVELLYTDKQIYFLHELSVHIFEQMCWNMSCLTVHNF